MRGDPGPAGSGVRAGLALPFSGFGNKQKNQNKQKRGEKMLGGDFDIVRGFFVVFDMFKRAEITKWRLREIKSY